MSIGSTRRKRNDKSAKNRAGLFPAAKPFRPDREFEDLPPDTLADCSRPDEVVTALWVWAGKVQTGGGILFAILLAAGMLLSIVHACAAFVTAPASPWQTGLSVLLQDWLLFGFLAWAEFGLYHILSLWLAAQAKRTHYAKLSAKLAEYEWRSRG